MAKTLSAATIWTALACDSGTRATGAIPLASCQEQLKFEGLLAAGSLSLSFPADWAGAAEVLPGRIVRLEYADADWDEYRIEEIDTGSPKGVTRITAKSILFDLALTDAIIAQINDVVFNPGEVDLGFAQNDTCTDVLTTILSSAPTYFSQGTITPATTVVSVTYNWTMPMTALSSLAEAVKAATGTTYYLSARRNGTSGYYLDLTDLNVGASTPDLRTGKNLLSLRKTYGRDWATRVYPKTTNATDFGCGFPHWRISAISANTYIDVVDPNGSGIAPIPYDDAVNGYYWFHVPATGGLFLRAITDSAIVGSAARLYMADTSSIAVDEYGRLMTSSSTTLTDAETVPYVDAPSLEASYGGRRVLTLNVPESDADQVLINANLANWTTTTCDYWTSSARWPIKDTAKYRSGGASAKITDDSGVSNAVMSTTRYVYWRVGDAIQYRLTWWGSGYSNPQWSYTNPTTAGTVNNNPTGGATHTDWTTMTSAVYSNAGAGRATVKTTFGGTIGFDANHWHVDGVEAILYRTALPTNTLFEQNTAKAWLRGVTYLRNPPVTYEATLLDLSRVNDGTWPYDAIVLGGPVNITDLDLNLTVSARVVSIDRNHLNPLATKVTLSTQRDTLTRLLVTGA